MSDENLSAIVRCCCAPSLKERITTAAAHLQMTESSILRLALELVFQGFAPEVEQSLIRTLRAAAEDGTGG